MKRLFKVFLVIFLGFALGACDIIKQILPGNSSSTFEYTFTLNQTELELDINETSTLTVTFNKEIENKKISWNSSNPSIASVNEEGLVTGVAQGSTTITATAANNYKVECIVTVYNLIESVDIQPVASKIVAGDLIELNATIYPTNVKDSTLSWSLEETDCASIENNVLTALKPGTIIINVVTINNKKDTIELTIYTNIEISFDVEDSIEIEIEKTKKINASISPSDIQFENINWYSENEEIATVESGLITALKEGKTNITASVYYEDIEIKKTIEISVVLPDVINVNFNQNGNENFIANSATYDNENGYYKFSNVGHKLTSPTVKTYNKNLTIEVLYKVTKSGNNNEDFNFKISAKKDEKVLSEISLNSSNTSFSSGDNLNTFKKDFPTWKSDDLANNFTFELAQKKTGSNFWLYGVKIYYTVENENVLTHKNISFHFLELGNKYTGDSIYIKAGETDILIDAGSQKSSATTITNYLNKYVLDNKLEYVIATHAHEDHIAGFVGSSSDPGILKNFKVDTIIDYALKNTTSQISKDYETLRDSLVANGTKHYTAADCINKTNGATDYFNLADGISFTVLNQIHYFEQSSDENDYSVCTLFTAGESNFLFTGDLEAGGEKSLVERNTLPHCVLYKAGHHGSKTSSNNELLSAITPEYVTVCCCAGSSEYTKDTDNMFPTQDFINRVAPYTTRVYVTTEATYTIEKDSKNNEYLKYNGFKSLNGTIVITYSNNEVSLNCSNHNTKLKDTEWFNRKITLNGVTRTMRTWPNVTSLYN